MAGGKETPRQKMIGMMYLVLTALLALNVSKQILDAFVAIEENTQKSNIVHFDRGTGAMSDLSSELAATKGADQAEKRRKIEFYLKQMKDIDKTTAVVIKFIDEIKVDIMKESGEDVSQGTMNDKLKIIWGKYDASKPCLPIRMNLDAINSKDQYDIPMHHLIGSDIVAIKGEGVKLWDMLNGYRNDLVKKVGTYSVPGGKSWNITPKAINAFKDNNDLTEQVTKMVKGSKANWNDDGEKLIELYMSLTKAERVTSGDIEGVHWMGKTFDHAPLVAALASLSSLQQDVLAARAVAMMHIKGKVTTGEYSFNKVMALAYAPAVANNGDDIEVKVMMAAFDSDNQPVVTYNGANVPDVKDGFGIVKTKANGNGEMILKGTVAIKKKSGDTKRENWETKVLIMKPQGTVSLPELNVLYIGYDNKVDAVASGYDQTALSSSGNLRLTKNAKGWIGKPSGGKTCTISVSGKSSITNKSVNLGTFTFRVSRLPDPELYWGGTKSGEKANKSETKLFAKYPPEIPLNAQFRIVSWECAVPGALGKAPTGTGGDISAAGNLIRAAKPGMNVSFMCNVVGPDGVQRKKGGVFKL